MKIAIISDIHSNYMALDAVLENLKKQKNIEKIFCLGDLVG
jgi:predicted phosphodiesterase